MLKKEGQNRGLRSDGTKNIYMHAAALTAAEVPYGLLSIEGEGMPTLRWRHAAPSYRVLGSQFDYFSRIVILAMGFLQS